MDVGKDRFGIGPSHEICSFNSVAKVATRGARSKSDENSGVTRRGCRGNDDSVTETAQKSATLFGSFTPHAGLGLCRCKAARGIAFCLGRRDSDWADWPM